MDLGRAVAKHSGLSEILGFAHMLSTNQTAHHVPTHPRSLGTNSAKGSGQQLLFRKGNYSGKGVMFHFHVFVRV